MAQDTLATLLETHKQEIARLTAQDVIAAKIPGYVELGQVELTRRFVAGVEMVARHLRDGNIAEYRQHVVKVAEERRKQGVSANEANAANLILATKMKTTIERKLAGPGNETIRSDYLRRLDVLLNMDRITGITAMMKKDPSKL